MIGKFQRTSYIYTSFIAFIMPVKEHFLSIFNSWVMLKRLSKFFGNSKSKAKVLGEELMSDPTIGRALVDISLRHGQGPEPVRVRIKDKVYLMKKLG